MVEWTCHGAKVLCLRHCDVIACHFRWSGGAIIQDVHLRWCRRDRMKMVLSFQKYRGRPRTISRTQSELCRSLRQNKHHRKRRHSSLLRRQFASSQVFATAQLPKLFNLKSQQLTSCHIFLQPWCQLINHHLAEAVINSQEWVRRNSQHQTITLQPDTHLRKVVQSVEVQRGAAAA